MVGSIAIGGLSFRIAAALICITCIFYTTVMRGLNKRRIRSRLFVALLSIILVECFTGFLSTIVMGTKLSPLAILIITYFCRMVYYTTHLAMIPMFCLYIMVVCDVTYKYSKRAMFLAFAPFWILELLIITNPFTGFYFTVDSNSIYTRSYGVYFAYAVSFIYVLFCIYLIARYWKSMNRIQQFAMFYFLAISTLGTIIQMLFANIVCELFAESLGLMGVMVLIERDEYRLDYKTNANNRTALIHDLKVYFASKREFYVICVRVINHELYRRVVGYEGYDALMGEIADFLMNIDDNYDVYRAGGGDFFLLCKDISYERVSLILGLIKERLGRSFKAGGGMNNVLAKILCVSCPDEISDVGDIMLLSETEIADSKKTVFRGKDLGFLLRKIDVEKAIVRGMAEDNFKVIYQPVYDKYSYTIHSAEAFLALKDPEYGKISFEEFMLVSEETGFAQELEYKMIDYVCRFIRDGVAHSELGISTLIIHIMSVQVLTEDLVTYVRACIDKYVIDPSLLVFYISDTIAMQAQDVTNYILDEFMEMGIRFVLVSNEAGVFGLGGDMLDKFDGVDINLKKLYDSDYADQADIILKNRTAMVNQLGKMVTLSGIDNRELFEKANKFLGDLIVGEYLSGPVSKNELQNKFWNMETLEFEDM